MKVPKNEIDEVRRLYDFIKDRDPDLDRMGLSILSRISKSIDAKKPQDVRRQLQLLPQYSIAVGEDFSSIVSAHYIGEWLVALDEEQEAE